MPRSQSRRLRVLHAQLAPGPTATDVDVDDQAVVINPAELEAAAEAAAAGELDPREVSPDVVRELMRPEAGFLGYHGPQGLTETERLMADVLSVPIDRAGLLPHTTSMFDATGRMTAAALAELVKRKDAAAAAEDYLTAQYLKHTIDALGPRPDGPLTIDDCVGSADDPEAAAERFFRLGFIVIRDCFSAEATSAMVAAWERAEASARPAWEAARRQSRGIARHGFPASRVPDGVAVVSRKFYGIGGSLFDLDEAFVDLIDTPAVLPVLWKNGLFEPFIYKNDDFTKTGSGQT